MENKWVPMSVVEAEAHFARSGIPWWIAGGQAIDLFLGWATRPHDDLDIEMLRSDSAALFDIFEGCELHLVSEDGVWPWTDPADLDDTVFALWVRPGPGTPWRIEILLADGDRDVWRFRSQPSIALAAKDLIMSAPGGLPYSTPEVQLLHKSLQARVKDDVDLARCLHRMDDYQRSWLCDAVSLSSPDHPWIRVLKASLDRQRE
jgi:hypothetical protein